MPVGLLRADNNLPPWRPGLKEVILYKKIVLILLFGKFFFQSERRAFILLYVSTLSCLLSD